MTIRQYAAMLLGTLVIALGLSLVPAHAEPGGQLNEDPQFIEEMLDRAEVEPGLTGFYEYDDMPSYLALDRPAIEKSFTDATSTRHVTALARSNESVLAADGPGGLRWSVLSRLALLAVLCFAVALYGRRSNA
ncbi:MAG: hypothetical protein AAF557_03470 [Pseudomonadota bacterium]